MADILQVFEAEMEVAPRRQNQPPLETSLKFIPALAYDLWNERVVRARVWRPNDVRDAVLDGHFCHAAGHLE